MRTWPLAILLFAFVAAALPTKAQETPIFELYGGYYFVHYTASPNLAGVAPSITENANGGGIETTFDPTHWLGLVGDFSSYAVTLHGENDTHEISYLAGPRFNLRSGRITPFAQVLFGRFWAEDGFVLGSIGSFAMTAGGGLDIRVNRHVSIRPIQAEYFLTKIPDGNTNRQNNFRFGAGVSVRFGSH